MLQKMALLNNKSHIFIYIVLTLFLIHLAIARPQAYEDFDMEDRCKSSDKIIEICQKCAKQTKSTIVYPMCCSNQEGVYDWCDRYIHYGYYGPFKQN